MTERLPTSRHLKTPISKLSPELLGIVFVRTTSLNHSVVVSPQPEFISFYVSELIRGSGVPIIIPKIKPEVALSHVSQYWRDVATTTPRIWSTVVVSPRNPTHPEMVERYLDRSGALPLNLKIASHDALRHDIDLAYDVLTPLSYMLAVVSTSSARWQTLDIGKIAWPYVLNLLDDDDIDRHLELPHLIELAFVDGGGMAEGGPKICLRVPRLQSLTLNEVRDNDPCGPGIKHKIPYEQLTHLSLTQCDNLRFIPRLLRLTANLRTLHLLQSAFLDETLDSGLPHISLCHLTHLELRIHQNIAPVLSLLQCKSLKHFTLIFNYVTTCIDSSEALTLLERSLPSVETIYLKFAAEFSDFVWCSDFLPGFIPVLSIARNVSRLAVTAETMYSVISPDLTMFTRAITQALAYDEQFMPSLKVLEFTNLKDAEPFQSASFVREGVEFNRKTVALEAP